MKLEELKKNKSHPTHFRVDKTIADDMYKYEPGTWWPLAGDLFPEEEATPESLEAWLDEMGRDDVKVNYATFDDPEKTYKVK